MYSIVSKHDQSSPFSIRHKNSRKIELADNLLLGKSGVTPGVFKCFAIENNIDFLCAQYNLREDFHFHKLPSIQEFFIVRIDEISQPADASVIAKNKYKGAAHRKTSLLSSLEEFTFFASKNSQVKTLEIIMPRRWFFSQLTIRCPYGLLKKYMAVKATKLQSNCSDFLAGNLFLDIIKESKKQSADFEYLKENVSTLLATFFSDISAGLHSFMESEKVKISKDEINRLMTVRKYLAVDLPPPSFATLAKIALMSNTSLKTKFKKMYGTTVFEYYQSMRMQRARILLLTHKYSVKQIGCHLGYSNMSNFTIAFKKEFNQLPHELIK